MKDWETLAAIGKAYEACVRRQNRRAKPDNGEPWCAECNVPLWMCAAHPQTLSVTSATPREDA